MEPLISSEITYSSRSRLTPTMAKRLTRKLRVLASVRPHTHGGAEAAAGKTLQSVSFLRAPEGL